MYIGLDLGTTSTKACAFTPEGRMVAEVLHPNELRVDAEGAAVQSAKKIVEGAAHCLRELVKQLDERPAGIGISCAMHAVVTCGPERGYSPVYTWADTRANALRPRVDAEQNEYFHRVTGAPVHPMSALLKLPWLRETTDLPLDPWFDLKGLLTGAWCEEGPLIDWQLAGATGLYDSGKDRWDDRAMRFALGPDADLRNHPRAVSPLTRLTWTEAAKTDLLGGQDIPLYIGGSDGVLANLGSGILDTGDVAVTVGTSGAVRTTHREAYVEPIHGLFNYRMLEDRFVVGGATNNGGKAVEFWWDLLQGHFTDVGEMVGAAFTVNPEDCPKFTPYLFGERAPIYDAEATASLTGLRGYHDHRHLARAVVEGVTANLIRILSSLEEVTGPAKRLLASGGFTRSAEWVELLSRRSGRRAEIVDTPQASAYGAALIAQMGVEKLSLDDLAPVP